MYEYLRAHPDVFMPDRREMNYFGSDLPLPNRLPDLETYLSFFTEAQPGQVVGEKSVNYLFSRSAAHELLEFDPEAKAIIMLRNPADVVFSLHRQFLFSANEDIIDLASALDAEDERIRGLRIPAGAHNPAMLAYTRVASFAPQVRRYLDQFGPDRVAVVIFDDFAADPEREYRSVLRFIGVDPEYEPGFEVHNPAKRVPNVAVRKFMKTHRGLSAVINRIVPEDLLDRARSSLARLQPQPERQLDPDLRRRLVEVFDDDISQLEALIDRDLSGWRLVPA